MSTQTYNAYKAESDSFRARADLDASRAAAVRRAAAAAPPPGVNPLGPTSGPGNKPPAGAPPAGVNPLGPTSGPGNKPAANIDISTPSVAPTRTINTRTNEAFIDGAPAPVTVKAPENTNIATPTPTRTLNTVTGEGFVDGKKVEPSAPPPPPPKSRFDLQREEVDADQAAEEKRRMDAIERFLAGRGLSDSGIALGQRRTALADIAMAAGRQRSAIGQEESRQDHESREADKGRIWASGENKEDRSLTTSENALGRTHQTDENREARIWQSGENLLGRKFTTSEREAIQVYNTLERIGIQSFEALEAALDRNLTTSERKAIQVWQDANREDEQVYGKSERIGAQDHQIGMYDKDVNTSVKLGVLNALVGSLDPKSPNFMAQIEEFTTRLFGPGIISARTGGEVNGGVTGGGGPVNTQKAPGMIRDTPKSVESFIESSDPFDQSKSSIPGPTGPMIPGRPAPSSDFLPSAGEVVDIAVNNPVTRAIYRWLT